MNHLFLESGDDAVSAGHMLMTYAIWAELGCPLVVLSYESARDLAETEPAGWDGAVCHVVLGLEIGEHFGFCGPAPDGVDQELGTVQLFVRWPAINFLPGGTGMLLTNILFALSERPQGLDVVERHPSAKAARKRGRKYFPGIEYIIGASTPVRTVGRGSPELGARRDEGWHWSVRSLTRGHWRRQACGPGWTEHRTLWVRPHWRGPDDAPVSVHAVRL